MQFLLVSALASSALASNLLSLPKELRVRQTDESFVPDSETIDACFSNQITCPGEYLGSLYCATPSDGDTCCSQGCEHICSNHASNGRWQNPDACPGGSFCLIDGYCCPDVSRPLLFTHVLTSPPPVLYPPATTYSLLRNPWLTNDLTGSRSRRVRSRERRHPPRQHRRVNPPRQHRRFNPPRQHRRVNPPRQHRRVDHPRRNRSLIYRRRRYPNFHHRLHIPDLDVYLHLWRHIFVSGTSLLCWQHDNTSHRPWRCPKPDWHNPFHWSGKHQLYCQWGCGCLWPWLGWSIAIDARLSWCVPD